MIEGPGHVPMHKIKENVDAAARGLPRGAVLHARPAHDRHRARLRPHHLGDRRGDDRQLGTRDALLRDAEGAPRPARPRRRQGGRDRLQDRRARGRPRQGPPGRAASATTRSARRASSSAGRTSSTSRSIPRPRTRSTTRRCRAEAAKSGALLLDVRPAVLLDEAHAGRARLRRRRRQASPAKARRVPAVRRRALRREGRPGDSGRRRGRVGVRIAHARGAGAARSGRSTSVLESGHMLRNR